MTMSNEWIYLHGIFLLPRRSESAKSIAIAPMVTVECIYGLSDKESIRIPRQYYV